MRKAYLNRIVTLLLVTAVIIGCRISQSGNENADPADILPADNDISGFQKKGSQAMMTDYQSIMDAIDGAGEKYIEYGFVEGVQQMYSNNLIDIDIRILNHGNEKNARAIFQEFYPSSAEILATGMYEAVVDHSNTIGYSLLYTRRNIFVEIHVGEKSKFALNMAKQFYQNIDKKIAPQ